MKKKKVRVKELSGRRGGGDEVVTGLKCEYCGCFYFETWNAPDAIWGIISNEYNLLCPQCFDELAREKGLTIVWNVDPELKEPPFYNPTLTILYKKLEVAENRLAEYEGKS